jgi:microcystin-dependent protein
MPNHNHSGVLSTGTAGNGFGVAVAALATSVGYTGGSGAHNNLQPYITCYMWKREA